jgi:hypothetical protein
MPEGITDEAIAQLRKQKEQTELTAQIAALTAPWWRRAGLITAMTAIIAAVLPVTKMIEEHYRSKRELALQEAKQDNDIRVAYLDRYQLTGQRRKTLRFLIGTSPDERMVAWAKDELAAVLEELEELDKQVTSVSEKIKQNPTGPVLDELKQQIDDLIKQRDAAALKPPPGAP